MKDTDKGKRIPFRRSTDGLVVAIIRDRILYKRVKQSVHFKEDEAGWAFDAREFRDKRGLFDKIVVYDLEAQVRYWTTTKVFCDRYQVVEHPPHGKQFVLPGRYWSVEPAEHQREMELGELRAGGEPAQDRGER